MVVATVVVVIKLIGVSAKGFAPATDRRGSLAESLVPRACSAVRLAAPDADADAESETAEGVDNGWRTEASMPANASGVRAAAVRFVCSAGAAADDLSCARASARPSEEPCSYEVAYGPKLTSSALGARGGCSAAEQSKLYAMPGEELDEKGMLGAGEDLPAACCRSRGQTASCGVSRVVARAAPPEESPPAAARIGTVRRGWGCALCRLAFEPLSDVLSGRSRPAGAEGPTASARFGPGRRPSLGVMLRRASSAPRLGEGLRFGDGGEMVPCACIPRLPRGRTFTSGGNAVAVPAVASTALIAGRAAETSR